MKGIPLGVESCWGFEQASRRGFEAGVASSLDVIDANDRLYQADVGLADARARLAQARVALDRALGM